MWCSVYYCDLLDRHLWEATVAHCLFTQALDWLWLLGEMTFIALVDF